MASLKRKEHHHSRFDLLSEAGTVVFEVTRNYQRGGAWEVRRPGDPTVLDVDRYSNDIHERAERGMYDKGPIV